MWVIIHILPRLTLRKERLNRFKNDWFEIYTFYLQHYIIPLFTNVQNRWNMVHNAIHCSVYILWITPDSFFTLKSDFHFFWKISLFEMCHITIRVRNDQLYFKLKLKLFISYPNFKDLLALKCYKAK